MPLAVWKPLREVCSWCSSGQSSEVWRSRWPVAVPRPLAEGWMSRWVLGSVLLRRAPHRNTGNLGALMSSVWSSECHQNRNNKNQYLLIIHPFSWPPWQTERFLKFDFSSYPGTKMNSFICLGNSALRCSTGQFNYGKRLFAFIWQPLWELKLEPLGKLKYRGYLPAIFSVSRGTHNGCWQNWASFNGAVSLLVFDRESFTFL